MLLVVVLKGDGEIVRRCGRVGLRHEGDVVTLHRLLYERVPFATAFCVLTDRMAAFLYPGFLQLVSLRPPMKFADSHLIHEAS
jgi:hypothetical protein